MSLKNQLYFIESASLQMEGIFYLHEHILGLLFGILLSVLILYRRLFLRFIEVKDSLFFFYNLEYKKNFYYFIEKKIGINQINENTKKFLELFWTIVPAFILIYIAGPSFALLYSIDEIIIEAFFTILVQGSQWYWNYEYYIPLLNESKSGISSYMLNEIDLELGQKRLLEVNAPIYIPMNLPTRFLITASDVLHSWAIPALSLKVDAVPGRLSQILIQPLRSGIFYGQCSEICGTNHGFMPIVVYCVDPLIFLNVLVLN